MNREYMYWADNGNILGVQKTLHESLFQAPIIILIALFCTFWGLWQCALLWGGFRHFGYTCFVIFRVILTPWMQAVGTFSNKHPVFWNVTPFIHSTGMCRMRRFLAILRSFFHASRLCNFPCHPSPPTTLPSSLTSFCHLFLGLPLSLLVPKFIYNTLLVILFCSTLCTCQNQCYLFNLIVSIIVGF